MFCPMKAIEGTGLSSTSLEGVVDGTRTRKSSACPVSYNYIYPALYLLCQLICSILIVLCFTAYPCHSNTAFRVLARNDNFSNFLTFIISYISFTFLLK